MESGVKKSSRPTAFPKNLFVNWNGTFRLKLSASDTRLLCILFSSFVIGDVRRPFIVKPLNVDWEIIRYDDSHAALQTSLFIDENKREPLKGSPDNGKYSALRIKFDLPACSYATVALRELLHTDLSKVTQKSKELERSARKTKNGADKG